MEQFKAINNLDTFAKTLITQINNIYAKSAQNSNSNDLSFKPESSLLIILDDTIKEGTFDVVNMINKEKK